MDKNYEMEGVLSNNVFFLVYLFYNVIKIEDIVVELAVPLIILRLLLLMWSFDHETCVAPFFNYYFLECYS